MSAAARWSLRLPRAATRHVSRPQNIVKRAEQKRYLRHASRTSRPRGPQNAKDNRQTAVGKNNFEYQAQRPEQPQRQASEQPPEQPEEQQPGRNAQLATVLAESNSADLVSEVHIPHDPDSVLPPQHPALSLLANSSLVIQRQIEMMNLFLGFEQANRYIIMDGAGQTLGYIAEQDHGIGRTMARQMFKTHRSFTTHIFDAQEREVLRIHRPFAYINSRIRIYDPVPEGGYEQTEQSTALQGTSASSATNQASLAQTSPLKLEDMRIIGEAQQQWAPLRRKYNLFTHRPLTPTPSDSTTGRLESGDRPNTTTTALTEHRAPDQAIEAGMAQFAHVNEPFLSWDFTLRDESAGTIGSVNRNFGGFAREIFTDTGVYALRMDSAAQTGSLESAQGEEVAGYERAAQGMALDQRAVMLATAVSIDFDYFSRHSSSTGGVGFMPLWFPGMGGAAEGGAAGAGVGAAGGAEAGTAVGAAEGAGAGALEGAAGRGIGAAGAGVGATESGIAGAGTMAGYEAMQRGRGGQSVDDASPQANEPFNDSAAPGGGGQSGGGDVWGEGGDPWGGGAGGAGGGPPPAGGSSGGGGEGGGGWGLGDFFDDIF